MYPFLIIVYYKKNLYPLFLAIQCAYHKQIKQSSCQGIKYFFSAVNNIRVNFLPDTISVLPDLHLK